MIVLIPDHCLSIYFEMPGNDDSWYACWGNNVICGYTGCTLLTFVKHYKSMSNILLFLEIPTQVVLKCHSCS